MSVCLSVDACIGVCACLHTHVCIRCVFFMRYPYLGICIMLSAMALVSFAGRAKAEPTRQTTTKRRKRKNSASSANSSVGNANSKKRSPASNFSLSSQVPVSISSTGLALSYTPIHHIQTLMHNYYRCTGRKPCKWNATIQDYQSTAIICLLKYSSGIREVSLLLRLHPLLWGMALSTRRAMALVYPAFASSTWQ